jgi:alkaline phosphatase
MREAVNRFNEAEVDLAFELGDYIDAAPDVDTEIGFLKQVDAEYARFRGERHYALGNHCVFTLTKQEFIDNSGMQAAHYSFDKRGFRFVVLDACYRADGAAYGRKNYHWTDANVPADQLDWLAADLKATSRSSIILLHHRLEDVEHYGVKNAAAVRRILEAAGNVAAVFCGHSHKNHHAYIGGIHYCVLRAMVDGAGAENSGYALVDLFADGSIRIDGFRKQDDYEWAG